MKMDKHLPLVLLIPLLLATTATAQVNVPCNFHLNAAPTTITACSPDDSTTITASGTWQGDLEWHITSRGGTTVSPAGGNPVQTGGNSLTIRAGSHTKSGNVSVRANRKGHTSCRAETTIEVIGFHRTDMTAGYPEKLIYPQHPGGAASHTFTLAYWAGVNDKLNGRWRHDYTLRSIGSISVRSEIINPQFYGGALAAAGVRIHATGGPLDSGGIQVLYSGAAADSRHTPVSSVTFSIAGQSLTVPVNSGANAVAIESLMANLTVPVDKESPENQSLVENVTVTVATSGQLTDLGNADWEATIFGEMEWAGVFRVQASHFQPCQ